jgi:hypothetical protein
MTKNATLSNSVFKLYQFMMWLHVPRMTIVAGIDALALMERQSFISAFGYKVNE